MIDVSSKKAVVRVARAEGEIVLKKETLDAIRKRTIKKGDVLTVAQVAAIQAVKRTPELIPLCHHVPIEGIEVNFEENNDRIRCVCKVSSTYKTGVEMEALAGVTAALLTIWDMTKYLEKDETGNYPTTKLDNIKVVKKTKRMQ